MKQTNPEIATPSNLHFTVARQIQTRNTSTLQVFNCPTYLKNNKTYTLKTVSFFLVDTIPWGPFWRELVVSIDTSYHGIFLCLYNVPSVSQSLAPSAKQ